MTEITNMAPKTAPIGPAITYPRRETNMVRNNIPICTFYPHKEALCKDI